MLRTIVTAICSSVAASLVTLAAVGATGPATVSAQPDRVLRVGGVELVDEAGKVRAHLGFGHIGSVGLWIDDPQGKRAISIGTSDVYGPQIVMFDLNSQLATPIWQAP
jgi:hypothetical protein